MGPGTDDSGEEALTQWGEDDLYSYEQDLAAYAKLLGWLAPSKNAIDLWGDAYALLDSKHITTADDIIMLSQAMEDLIRVEDGVHILVALGFRAVEVDEDIPTDNPSVYPQTLLMKLILFSSSHSRLDCQAVIDAVVQPVFAASAKVTPLIRLDLLRAMLSGSTMFADEKLLSSGAQLSEEKFFFEVLTGLLGSCDLFKCYFPDEINIDDVTQYIMAKHFDVAALQALVQHCLVTDRSKRSHPNVVNLERFLQQCLQRKQDLGDVRGEKKGEGSDQRLDLNPGHKLTALYLLAVEDDEVESQQSSADGSDCIYIHESIYAAFSDTLGLDEKMITGEVVDQWCQLRDQIDQAWSDYCQQHLDAICHSKVLFDRQVSLIFKLIYMTAVAPMAFLELEELLHKTLRFAFTQVTTSFEQLLLLLASFKLKIDSPCESSLLMRTRGLFDLLELFLNPSFYPTGAFPTMRVAIVRLFAIYFKPIFNKSCQLIHYNPIELGQLTENVLVPRNLFPAHQGTSFFTAFKRLKLLVRRFLIEVSNDFQGLLSPAYNSSVSTVASLLLHTINTLDCIKWNKAQEKYVFAAIKLLWQMDQKTYFENRDGESRVDLSFSHLKGFPSMKEEEKLELLWSLELMKLTSDPNGLFSNDQRIVLKAVIFAVDQLRRHYTTQGFELSRWLNDLGEMLEKCVSLESGSPKSICQV